MGPLSTRTRNCLRSSELQSISLVYGSIRSRPSTLQMLVFRSPQMQSRSSDSDSLSNFERGKCISPMFVGRKCFIQDPRRLPSLLFVKIRKSLDMPSHLNEIITSQGFFIFIRTEQVPTFLTLGDFQLFWSILCPEGGVLFIMLFDLFRIRRLLLLQSR